jgi:hypothetical protein
MRSVSNHHTARFSRKAVGSEKVTIFSLSVGIVHIQYNIISIKYGLL